jgi:hypothetical protein
MSTATDELFWCREREFIVRSHCVAWFARRLAIDHDRARHYGALGFLAAIAQPSVNQSLV